MLQLRVDDLAGTHAVAAAIAGVARAGDVIVLAGAMGAGKTAFAQGFGRALGVTEPITSPTFTLVHSYPLPSRLTLHHADLYRLDRTGDVEDLALHELAAFKGIVLIEWGDVAGAALGDHLEVRLDPLDDADLDDADLDDADAEAGAALGDHLEVRLDPLDDADLDDADLDDADLDDADAEADATVDADADAEAGADPGDGDQDEFADPGTRMIELRAVGPAWAGRWDRIARAVEAYRC